MSWINRDDLIEWLHTEEDEMLEIDDQREAHEASYIRKHVREMPGMDVGQVMQELKALGALEDADLAKTVKEYCAAQSEPLTDKEQRIFLAAMGREEKVCKQVDEECRDCREAYEDSIVKTCHEIIRKVKGALWT